MSVSKPGLDPAESFPVSVSIDVAWSDMDAFRHVNNAVYFRYFETARIAYFAKIGALAFMEEHGIGPILSHTECRFRLPLSYPDTVTVAARVSELGEDRFLMHYQLRSPAAGGIAAYGTGRIVYLDYRTGAKTRLPDELRRAICGLEGKNLQGQC